MRTRGISLIELLLTVVLLAITLGATLNAFVTGLSFEKRFSTTRSTAEEIVHFEESISSSLAEADLSDSNSEFVSPIPSGTNSSSVQTPLSPLPAGSSSLVWTTWNSSPSTRYIETAQGTWEALNAKYGAEGGTSQLALSMIPAGDAGLRQGLFIRQQQPPQPDLSKGGNERVDSAMVQDIRFEFYDGTTWQTVWDSRSGTEKGKMPSAVRITYLRRDEQAPRTFIVRLRLSPNQPTGASS